MEQLECFRALIEIDLLKEEPDNIINILTRNECCMTPIHNHLIQVNALTMNNLERCCGQFWLTGHTYMIMSSKGIVPKKVFDNIKKGNK